MELSAIRCPTCVGSKQVMGGGMIMHDCPACEGVGKLYRQVGKEVAPSDHIALQTYNAPVAPVRTVDLTPPDPDDPLLPFPPERKYRRGRQRHEAKTRY